MFHTLPPELQECLELAALRLGHALDQLDWPNGGKDAPCHEANAVLHIAAMLGQMDPPFAVYAEGVIGTRGRIDLMACNGPCALALEAKSFGKLNKQAGSVLLDLDRLRRFVPALTPVVGLAPARDWWNAATERWGILVIASFRGNAARDAWLANEDAEVYRYLADYKRHDQAREEKGTATGFLALHQALRSVHRGAASITSGERWGAGEGWLLWGALPLPRSEAVAG